MGVMPIVIGDGANDLSADCGDNCKLMDTVEDICLYCVYFGIASSIFSTLSKYIWTYVASDIEKNIKVKYFNTILHMDISWYDRKSPEKITSEFNLNSQAYIKAVGFSNSQIGYSVGLGISAFIVSCVYAVIYALINIVF